MTPQITPPADAMPEPNDGQPIICPILTLAGETFERDLPELIRDHYGEWTAYHGARRLGIVKTYREAIGLYRKFGIDPFEVIVRGIQPIPEVEFIGFEYDY